MGLIALVFALMSGTARAQQVVISQIYGGGGNAGATFNRDYIELHNRGTTPVAIAGYSIQYAASTGSSFSSTTQMVRLTGAAPIPAGGYFLVATTTSGTVGAALSADLLAAAGNLVDMAATGGKVFLVSNQTLVSATPSVAQHQYTPAQMATLGIVDMVGYGQAATVAGTLHTAFEGRSCAPVLSATLAAFRKNNGDQETHDNFNDFTAATPAPRNLASAPTSATPTGACCLGGSGLYLTAAACATAGGTYNGDFSILGGVTYTKTAGTNPMIDISGTGTLLTALDNSDDGNVTLNLPIPIQLYGNVRSTITINSNGIIKMSPRDSVTGSDFTPAAIPTLAVPNDYAAPLWMDLFPRTTQTGAHVYVQQQTAPNRLIVQWKATSTRASSTVTPDNLNFQAIFNQDDGSIEYRYGAMTASVTTPATTATAPMIGVEDQSGTLGPNNLPVATIAGLSNTSVLFTPVSASPCSLGAAPSVLGLSTPAVAVPGAGLTLTGAVTSNLTPASTGVTVVANLTAIGGGAAVALLDNGAPPDTGVDNVFTASFTLGLTVAPGVYSLPLTVTDAQGRVGTGSIALSVTPANDLCGGAIALSLDTPVAGTTAGAANDFTTTATNPPYSGVGQTTSTAPGTDVVYSFTAPAAGSYSFRLRGYSTAQNPVLYVATACPPTTVLAAANRTTTTGSEEVMCQTLTAGQTVYVYVDDNVAANAGSSFLIEVNRCFQEVEPNDSPAAANGYAFPTEGSISVANEADFYALGNLNAGDRVFAFTDGLSSNTADWQMRITTSTDTLEFDDDDGDSQFGISGFNPVIAGRPATGGPTFVRVSPLSTTVLSEPYRLSVAVQPPIGSATVEAEPNDTVAQAQVASYASGALSATTDVDMFSFTANAGALIYLAVDGDPLKDNTGIDTTLALLDSAGAVLVSVNGSTTGTVLTASPGTLTGTTPTSPAEGLVFRALTSGTYVARVTGAAAGDYLLSVKVSPSAYCAPTISTPCAGNEFISNVVAGSINNSSTCGIGLENFTALSTSVGQSGTLPVTITTTNAFTGDSMTVYADWNQNGVLDDAGEVTTGTFATPMTLNLSVPANAVLGATRMRIRLNYEPSDALPGPCGNSTYGNIEDYTLIVTGATAPSNDTCATAAALPLGTLTGNISQATNDGVASCDPGGAASKDVWYTFTNGASATTFSIDTCGSTFDTVLSIYDACGGTELACSDNCGGTPCGATSSCLTLALAANQTIKIRLSDKGTNGTNWTIHSSNLLPPTPNDDCSGAILVTCGSSTNGSTAATAGFLAPTIESPLPPACTGPGGGEGGQNLVVNSPGVWYRIVGTGQTVYADTLVAAYDTSISVYTGSCGSLSCVTINDDAQGSPFHSKVAFTTFVGQDYYILVHGSGATNVGTFTLNVTCDATPANDLCSAPAVISGFSGSLAATNVGATGDNSALTSTTIASCATTYSMFDTWYSYTATCDGNLTLGTCGTFDTVLSVHTSCPGAAGNQIAGACSNDATTPCGPGSQVTLAVTNGTTYLIRVATNGPATTQPGGGQPFTLTWNLVGTDTDGDGTPDCTDGCPNDPLKIAPGVCGCGTPDTDTDGDGTPNCNDGCPNDPAKIAPGICGCGTPDTDTDGDGTADCLDGCPNDPAKIAPGICGCGTPDTDTDGDGTADCLDGCPNDPLKVAPGVCGCGVPDTDTDGDGTPNCNDGCPNDPLKVAPGICGCGVADTDTDGDGTADCLDGCPNDPLKVAPGICGCGVADTDTDGDGTADCIDGCPNDPLKTAPGQCGCGVVDTDTDGDGVADCNDNCDTTPNPVQGDVDNDGVGDACDNCITIANPGQGDCDNDTIGDACEIALGAPDCNLNGIPDICDITNATSQDANLNGIPDECELNGGTPYCFGDGTTGACPCGNNSVVGSQQGCVNSSGLGTKLVGSGLTSISADGLSLNVSNLPVPAIAPSFVLFFQGAAQTNVPFADGRRCAGGATVRLAVKAYSGSTASYPGVLDPSVHVKGLVPLTGGVRYYQVWHRDISLPCGSNSNLSNGVSVIWVP